MKNEPFIIFVKSEAHAIIGIRNLDSSISTGESM
jgi:hypothetical protein